MIGAPLEPQDFEAARTHVRLAEHWGLLDRAEMLSMLARLGSVDITDADVSRMRDRLQTMAESRRALELEREMSIEVDAAHGRALTELSPAGVRRASGS